MQGPINTDELKTGGLVLFSGMDVYSKLVKVSTRSKWSHIGLILKTAEHDCLTMWESSIREDTLDVETGCHREGVRLLSFIDRVTAFEGDVSIRQLQGGTLSDDRSDDLLGLRKELRGRSYERNKFELLKEWAC